MEGHTSNRVADTLPKRTFSGAGGRVTCSSHTSFHNAELPFELPELLECKSINMEKEIGVKECRAMFIILCARIVCKKEVEIRAVIMPRCPLSIIPLVFRTIEELSTLAAPLLFQLFTLEPVLNVVFSSALSSCPRLPPNTRNRFPVMMVEE